MPNFLQGLSRKVGLQLLKMGGIGRMTPVVSYGTDADTYPLGSVLMSDYHYIAHPISDRGGYRLEVDYNLSAFDDAVLPQISIQRMIRLLKNNNALISQSLLNFRQFVTYGYRLEGTPRAKSNIERILRILERRRKPLSLLLGQLAEGIYVGGGAYTEIILDSDGMETIDFVVNDPLNVAFQLRRDAMYGEDFWLVKVNRNGSVTSLNGDPTIQYIPVNGDVNSPFGKPFMLAAIFPAVWQLLLLKDIRDVLRSQVYPFVHVKIDMDKLLTSSENDPKKAEGRAQKSQASAISAWQNKKNNTAIATGDEVEYSIISGLNRANLGMIDPVIDMLSAQVSSGASMMPLFLGHNDSTTETNADVQWMIEVAIIRSVQREINQLMTYNFNLMNQAAGVGGEIDFMLLMMDAMERLREGKVFEQEEQALVKLIDHLTSAYASGLMTMDEMIEQYKSRRQLIYLEK